MIVVGNKQFVTLNDDFYVNGSKVLQAFCNGKLVYPCRGNLIKVRGECDCSFLCRYTRNTKRLASGINESGSFSYPFTGVFEAVLRMNGSGDLKYGDERKAVSSVTNLRPEGDVYPFDRREWLVYSKNSDEGFNIVPWEYAINPIWIIPSHWAHDNPGFQVVDAKARIWTGYVRHPSFYYAHTAHSTVNPDKASIYTSESCAPMYNGVVMSVNTNDGVGWSNSNDMFTRLRFERLEPTGWDNYYDGMTVKLTWTRMRSWSLYNFYYDDVLEPDNTKYYKSELVESGEEEWSRPIILGKIPITEILYIGDYNTAPEEAKTVDENDLVLH